MKTSIFAKKGTTREGKTYWKFIGTLHKKDGTELRCRVKFREDCGSPKPDECPLNIEFPRECGNLVEETYTREDTGEEATAYTLWLSKWDRSKEVYRDSSLDDFE